MTKSPYQVAKENCARALWDAYHEAVAQRKEVREMNQHHKFPVLLLKSKLKAQYHRLSDPQRLYCWVAFRRHCAACERNQCETERIPVAEELIQMASRMTGADCVREMQDMFGEWAPIEVKQRYSQYVSPKGGLL